LRGGAAFFPALIAAIDASVHEVRLETYIFSFDSSGDQVAAFNRVQNLGWHF
jgi:cardiolipin synthase